MPARKDDLARGRVAESVGGVEASGVPDSHRMTELTLLVDPPAIDVAVQVDRAGVLRARGDPRSAHRERHLHGCRPAIQRAAGGDDPSVGEDRRDSELAVGVVAPAPHLAAAEAHARVGRARGDLRDLVAACAVHARVARRAGVGAAAAFGRRLRLGVGRGDIEAAGVGPRIAAFGRSAVFCAQRVIGEPGDRRAAGDGEEPGAETGEGRLGGAPTHRVVSLVHGRWKATTRGASSASQLLHSG